MSHRSTTCGSAVVGGVRVALSLACLVGAVACGGGSSKGQGRNQAVEACHAYVSVNGMTGDEGRAAYHRGVQLAQAAASSDSRWTALATGFRTLSKWSDDIQALADAVSTSEQQAGIRAGLTVARQCQV